MDDLKSTSAQEATSAATRPRGAKRVLAVVSLGLLLGIAPFWWNSNREKPPAEEIIVESDAPDTTGENAAKDNAGEKAAAVPEESSARKMIVGVWEQFNKGKRLLTVLDDGTATMDVSLEGAWATIVGQKLEFRIEWEIQGERLLFKMTGGKPAGSLKLLSSIYGNERNHRIETLSNDQLILIDENDKSRDIWKRVVPTTH